MDSINPQDYSIIDETNNKESFTNSLINNAIQTITNSLTKNDFVSNIAGKVIEPVTNIIYVKSKPYIYAGILMYLLIVALLIIIIVLVLRQKKNI